MLTRVFRDFRQNVISQLSHPHSKTNTRVTSTPSLSRSVLEPVSSLTRHGLVVRCEVAPRLRLRFYALPVSPHPTIRLGLRCLHAIRSPLRPPFKQFTEFYYSTFDSDRSNLAALYVSRLRPATESES